MVPIPRTEETLDYVSIIQQLRIVGRYKICGRATGLTAKYPTQGDETMSKIERNRSLYHVYTTMGNVWVRASSEEEAVNKAVNLVADHGIPAVLRVVID